MIKQQKKKLWKIFSLYIRLRDSNAFGYAKCITCDKVEHYKRMDAGHFIPRAYLYTCFLEKNVHAQCRDCNRNQSGNTAIYAKRLDGRYGKGTADVLRKLKDVPVIFTSADYAELIKKYKAKIKEFGGQYGV